MTNRNQQKDDPCKVRWRELGFYFDFDHDTQEQCIFGDQKGLEAFVAEIRSYAISPFNTEHNHDHLGPYMNLELRTATPAALGEGLIQGLPEDFLKLALEVESKIQIVKSGESFTSDYYGKSNGVELKFLVQPCGFDPSSLDPY